MTTVKVQLSDNVYERTQGSLTRRLLTGTFWLALAVALVRGATLIAMIAVARIVDQESFGAIGIIQSTVFTAGVFFGTGMGMGATTLIAQHRRSGHQSIAAWVNGTVFLTVCLSGGMACVLIMSAPFLAEHVFGQSGLSGPLRISSLLLIFTALNMAQAGILAGFEAFRAQACVNAIAAALAVPQLILAAYVGGTHGVVWGLVIAMATNCLLFQLSINRLLRLESVSRVSYWDAKILKRLGGLGLPAVLLHMTYAPTDWICSAMLAGHPNGYRELGGYYAANHLFGVCRLLCVTLGSALLPIMAQAATTMDRGNMCHALLRPAILLNFALSAPFICVGSLASPWLMALFGPGYSIYWPTLVVLMIAIMGVSLQVTLNRALYGFGWMWTVLCLNVCWSACFVGINYILVDNGAVGLAGARCLSLTIHAVVLVIVAKYALSDAGPKQPRLNEQVGEPVTVVAA
jgi:O-antigen/teichoic acid export membrane protein